MDIAGNVVAEVKKLRLEDIIELAKNVVILTSEESNEKRKAFKRICKILKVEKNSEKLISELEDKIVNEIDKDENLSLLADNVEVVFENITKVIRTNFDALIDGKISPDKFIAVLVNTGATSTRDMLFDNVSKCAEKELGQFANVIKGGDAVKVAGMPWYAISYVCLTKAYENVKKAESEFVVARDERIATEKACMDAIELIRMYRLELNICVEKYLCNHIETFERALMSMDEYLLEDDTNGYLMANADIQKLLKYDVQFANRKEFDSIMKAEVSFKL